jgi:hypothetical protein
MKNSIMLKITTFSKLIIFFFGLCLFASCSNNEAVTPSDKAIPFDSKTYKFVNQDEGSVAARKAIDSNAKGKSSRSIYYSGGFANYGFNPSGYIYGVFNEGASSVYSGGSVYRQSAFVQNYSSEPLSFEIEVNPGQGSGKINNISLTSGSFNQTNQKTYRFTIPAYTDALTSFDFNVASTVVEAYARIIVINAPSSASPNGHSGYSPYANDWVYPIGFNY